MYILSRYKSIAIIAIRDPYSREEDPHIIINFGYCPDRGARAPADRLLVDGDGGRETLDVVDFRFLHLF